MDFGAYLQHFGDFATIYGSLGAAMALLVWMYLISLVVLVAAEFNALLFPRAMLGKELTAINGPKRRHHARLAEEWFCGRVRL